MWAKHFLASKPDTPSIEVNQMSAWTNFKGVNVIQQQTTASRPRFSLTSDILSFRRCSRQYSYFGNDGFVPAQATQIFYGTIIHQVLDRCHRHYWGLIGNNTKGHLPQDADIDRYFDEVKNALRSHGVRPASQNVAEQARLVVKIFNRVEGPTLYPLIKDTEFRLESERNQFVLRGVVDVLTRNPSLPNDPSQMEIWDYKGTRCPDLSSAEMKDYLAQMCVYAELYKAREGSYPAKAILYFLNELNQTPEPSSRPPRAVYEVQLTDQDIQQALNEFDTTAQQIIQFRNSGVWPLPTSLPPEETCDICDIRWNCTVPKKPYKVRMPIIS